MHDIITEVFGKSILFLFILLDKAETKADKLTIVLRHSINTSIYYTLFDIVSFIK